jgi:hypothetical protein
MSGPPEDPPIWVELPLLEPHRFLNHADLFFPAAPRRSIKWKTR